MRISLFSFGHLNEAHELWPDKVNNRSWLTSQWTTEEINACKKLFFERSIRTMTKEQYESKYGISRPRELAFSILNFFEEQIQDRASKILSIGCGLGDKEIILARKGYNITAIDNHPFMWWLKDVFQEVNFIDSCDACSLPFTDEYFDVVYSNGVIYAISDQDLTRFFYEIARVL